MYRFTSVLRVGALAVLLFAWTGTGYAQAVKLEFHDGQVNLTTQNASVRAILAEWARLGGTQVVNADRVSGPPLTLQLNNVSETQALDIIMRGNAGYIAGLRAATAVPGARSALDRILVVPTAGSAIPPAAPRPAVVQPPFATVRPAVQQPPPDPDDDPVSDVPPNDEPPVRNGRQGGPFTGPRGGGPNQQAPAQPFQPFQVQDEDRPEPAPNTPAPANPFGIQSGSPRPGTISPVPQPQNQRPQQRDPEP
jgi:hypothetical protein